MAKKTFLQRVLLHKELLLFMVPAVVLLIVFNYVPMVGVLMSFQKYDPVSGFFGSEWVGLDNFRRLIFLPDIQKAFLNTLFISSLKLIFVFPAPIIFALMLNEIRFVKAKKIFQSISYLPNFISWVVVAGFVYQIFSATGIINNALVWLGIIKEPVYFMQESGLFYLLLILSELWKNLGFASIIYIAAITSIDQEQYEAAAIDGAGRLKQAMYITLPSIMGTVSLMLIFQISGILNAGFDQIWTLSNSAVQDVAEILDTYALRLLLKGTVQDLSLGASLSFLKATIGLPLFFLANSVSKKLRDQSLV